MPGFLVYGKKSDKAINDSKKNSAFLSFSMNELPRRKQQGIEFPGFRLAPE